MSDRVFVIYEGRIMGEIPVGVEEPSAELIETIGLMMTGTRWIKSTQGEAERNV